MLENIKTIAVIGAGAMGPGIAQVASMARFKVILIDNNEEAFKRADETIRKNLHRLTLKDLRDLKRKEAGGISTIQRDDILARITTTIDLKEAANADFVVEAITENPEVKFKMFRDLEEIVPKGVIIASNTSTINIQRLGEQSNRREKVIGMHFMNPVPMMKLVEVVKADTTADETVKIVVALAEKLGKTPVVVRNFPGFVVNRVLIPMINEAIICLQDGISTREGIDACMKLGANHPMGPLALADLIGLDVCLAIMEVLHADLGDDKYLPCPLLETMVVNGKLGKKTKKGFYVY